MNLPAFLFRTGAVTLLIGTRLLGAETPDSPARPVTLKLTAQFDRDGDHRLDATERRAALAWLAQHPPAEVAATNGRPGLLAIPTTPLEPTSPGMKVGPDDVTSLAGHPLYEAGILRTLFLNFDEADWEQELAAFARTDVRLPARATLDGRSYDGVGVHCLVGGDRESPAPGYKRSLQLYFDHTNPGQNIGGQRELRLLDARTDPTFLRTALYVWVAREFGPAPQVNFVRVVVNGENWGVFTSVQPFDENFARAHFNTTAGARWTVHPGGNFAYLGDNPDAYRDLYELESPDNPAAWTALIQFCKTLAQTPAGELRPALVPQIDLDSVLMFFALENAFMNQDGYSGGNGDFGLYLDNRGRFHLIPLDAERSFRLRQVTEYGERRAGRSDKSPTDPARNPESADAVVQRYNPKDFPHQTGTDLAMLLSYSFINKADADLDGKVTLDEWQAFSRAWFAVMDEDFMGRISREQFLTKVRLQITPKSITDGRTKQTFGQDDPAGLIAQDFFNALDDNHDGQLTSDELTGAMSRLFARWCDPKSRRLTQDLLQRGFSVLFTRSVFQADQAYIAKRGEARPGEEDKAEGRSGRGRGNSVGVGPLRFLGLGGKGAPARGVIVFHEELDPLAGMLDPTKPLLVKLLADPELRARYLADLQEIKARWMTWAKLGPIAKAYHELIAAEVARDTHKATSYEHFVQELDQETNQGAREGDEAPSLRNFVTERSAYLEKSGLLPESGTGP